MTGRHTGSTPMISSRTPLIISWVTTLLRTPPAELDAAAANKATLGILNSFLHQDKEPAMLQDPDLKNDWLEKDLEKLVYII